MAVFPWFETHPDLPSGRKNRHPYFNNLRDDPLVVEDADSLRRGYASALEEEGYGVVAFATVADTHQFLQNSEVVVDAALLDYDLPDGTAFDLVGELLEREPLCKSLIVTGVGTDETGLELAQAGVHGYLHTPVFRSVVLAEIAATVQATIEWRAMVGQVSRLAGGQQHEDPTPPLSQADWAPVSFDVSHATARLRRLGKLSRAQTLTAFRLLWGDSNRQVATFLGCSVGTAAHHVAEVLERTGAGNRSELLRVLLIDAGVRDTWGRRRT